MTVRRSDEGPILLEGDCPIQDAEPLLQLMLADPEGPVDWTACDAAHGAIVQVLLASRARLFGPPRGAFLRDYVDAALARAEA